ncbi:unnamed protein product [Cuscuta europaea]|uniref:SWIM-type domain-containing protein n=1 Tax=Cuscuta europaea TaxID=41803 RepID=A0A9P0ZAY0_CUSEU|nr:unnamed protein product [Cuscuta europaea]
MSLKHEVKHCFGSVIRYLVWMPHIDQFSHWVSYNTTSHFVDCSCKRFQEVGILCCHCLRIYHIHCVEVLPDSYVLKRWTRIAKSVEQSQSSMLSNTSNVLSSVWRMKMQRKLHKLLCSIDSNASARLLCEESFKKLKHDIEEQVGSIYFSHSDSASIGVGTISNPKSSRKKSERNVRCKSIVEIKSNQARGRKKSTAPSTSLIEP